MDVARSEVLVIGTSVACRSCQARHGVVCGALSAGQLSELGRHSLRRKVDAGCEIIAQGSENSFYSNITRGVVKLCKVMSDGRQQIVGLQFAPDFVGRPFVRESTLSAEAATDAEICVFPRNLLERMILETRELQRSLHAQALNELDAAREWMLTLGRRTAEEKVASLLHLIAAHAETATSTAFDPAAIACRDCRLSRADDRNRQPPVDPASQRGRHPHREHPAYHRARHGCARKENQRVITTRVLERPAWRASVKN
ncbi:transcriptional regulator protein, Fnr/CRP family (plasmid) [Rhizobium phaseoli Ch24-10]|nr:transcriptional regulator protein, Fnr/CRP family [Rhizobium phaseoli Ch24-10]